MMLTTLISVFVLTGLVCLIAPRRPLGVLTGRRGGWAAFWVAVLLPEGSQVPSFPALERVEGRMAAMAMGMAIVLVVIWDLRGLPGPRTEPRWRVSIPPPIRLRARVLAVVWAVAVGCTIATWALASWLHAYVDRAVVLREPGTPGAYQVAHTYLSALPTETSVRMVLGMLAILAGMLWFALRRIDQFPDPAARAELASQVVRAGLIGSAAVIAGTGASFADVLAPVGGSVPWRVLQGIGLVLVAAAFTRPVGLGPQRIAIQKSLAPADPAEAESSDHPQASR